MVFTIIIFFATSITAIAYIQIARTRQVRECSLVSVKNVYALMIGA